MQHYKSMCAQLHFPFSFLIPNPWILIILTKYINWFHPVPEGVPMVYSLEVIYWCNFPLLISPLPPTHFHNPQCIYIWFSPWFSIHFFLSFSLSNLFFQHFMPLRVFKCFLCFISLPTNNVIRFGPYTVCKMVPHCDFN